MPDMFDPAPPDTPAQLRLKAAGYRRHGVWEGRWWAPGVPLRELSEEQALAELDARTPQPPEPEGQP